LKAKAAILFEPPNERWELFKELYRGYFSTECPAAIVTRDWLKLGFQGDHPERDLRGGGVLSLELINDFAARENHSVKDMEKEGNDFFFAVSSINISFFMKKFFHLQTLTSRADHDHRELCSRLALKNFCRLLLSNRNAYADLHRLFLLHLYHTIWMGLKRTGSNITLLNFNQAFDTLREKVIRTFNDR
jgi:hypothetical protein